jgi:tetratricopeptide (TPR) repeat protein
MYDLGESDGTHYITMEYVPGEDLRSLLKRIGRLPEDKALSIAKQAADGLAEAHHLEIVHRDLKPGNIMVDREGNAKVMDFGIARSAKLKVVTRTGMIVGTPDYMSPEQAEAKEVDGRSDVYSLAVAMKHKSERPRDPRELTPQISTPTARLILRCLENDPDRRFASAADLGAEIGSIAGAATPGPRRSVLRKPAASREITVTFKPMKALLPSAAAIALVAAGLVFWRVVLKPAPATRSVAVIHFQNQTGNADYDYLRDAIPNLLITSLEQSKYLQVTTFERLRDLLRQSGKADAGTIDAELGFDLCRRDGVEALVLGTYVKAGEIFATDVKIYDVGTRKLIKSYTAQGVGAQSILDKQIAQLSKEISRGVGLSRKAVNETGAAMAQAPTNSIEAYKYYLEGQAKMNQMFFEDARKDLEKALAIDPECAIAHLYISAIYQRLGNMSAVFTSLQKAKELSSRATEKDRLLIESQYASRVEQDTEKRFRLLEGLVSRFPKEKESYSPLIIYYMAHHEYPEALAAVEKALALDPKWVVVLNQLASIYEAQGDTAKAIETLEKAVIAVPDAPNLFDSLGEIYARSGRLETAIENYKKAIAIKPDFGSEEIIAYLRAVQGNYPDALTWIDQFILMAPNNESKGRGYWWKAIFDHLSGRRARAAQEMERVRTLTESLKNRYGTAMAAYGQVYLRFDRGEYDGAAASMEEGQRIARELSAGSPSFLASTNALGDFERELLQGYIAVRRGQTETARRHVSALEAALPKFREFKFGRGSQVEQSFTILRAEVFLLEGKPSEAITLIEKDFMYQGNRQMSIAFEFVDEVQFKASGYEAKFGGSLGGVVNVITRQGGNVFHGEVLG